MTDQTIIRCAGSETNIRRTDLGDLSVRIVGRGLRFADAIDTMIELNAEDDSGYYTLETVDGVDVTHATIGEPEDATPMLFQVEIETTTPAGDRVYVRVFQVPFPHFLDALQRAVEERNAQRRATRVVLEGTSQVLRELPAPDPGPGPGPAPATVTIAETEDAILYRGERPAIADRKAAYRVQDATGSGLEGPEPGAVLVWHGSAYVGRFASELAAAAALLGESSAPALDLDEAPAAPRMTPFRWRNLGGLTREERTEELRRRVHDAVYRYQDGWALFEAKVRSCDPTQAELLPINGDARSVIEDVYAGHGPRVSTESLVRGEECPRAPCDHFIRIASSGWDLVSSYTTGEGRGVVELLDGSEAMIDFRRLPNGRYRLKWDDGHTCTVDTYSEVGPAALMR